MPTNWAGLTIANLSSAHQLPFLQDIINNPIETRVIQGVAGSGKTLVAAFAVGELARIQNCELLVFTNLLKQYILQNFSDRATIEDKINHFHHYRYNALPQRSLYIIDEAQDFEEKWIDNIKNNSRAQIWIGDEQQKIYEQAAPFKDLINTIAAAQKYYFPVNYRSSLINAQLALNFITLSDDELNNGISIEQKNYEFLNPMLMANRNRANERPVLLIKATNEKEEFDAIAKKIIDIQGNQMIGSKRIAIAHMTHPFLDQICIELKDRGIKFYRKEREFNHNELPNFSDDNLIVVSPIHSLKGLEFDYVFFPRSERANDYEDEGIRNNLLFVLFTRAKEGIFVSHLNEDMCYVWNQIKDQISLDYIEKINASDILAANQDDNATLTHGY